MLGQFLEWAKYYIKTQKGVSTEYYQSSEEMPLNGPDKEAGEDRTCGQGSVQQQYELSPTYIRELNSQTQIERFKHRDPSTGSSMIRQDAPIDSQPSVQVFLESQHSDSNLERIHRQSLAYPNTRENRPLRQNMVQYSVHVEPYRYLERDQYYLTRTPPPGVPTPTRQGTHR